MFIHCPTGKSMFVCRENCGSGTSQWAPVGDKRMSTKIIPCTQRKSWFGEVYIRHNCSKVSVMPRQEYPNIWKSSLKFGWFCFLIGTLILFFHFSNKLWQMPGLKWEVQNSQKPFLETVCLHRRFNTCTFYTVPSEWSCSRSRYIWEGYVKK